MINSELKKEINLKGPKLPSDKKVSKILLAEDNALNQVIFQLSIKKHGFVPVVAENGSIAIDLIKKEEYPIIFMDVQMDVMDGIEATKAIRAMEGTLGYRPIIIAMTASSDAADVETCLSVGMDYYISKPFTDGELVELFSVLGVNK